MKNDLFNQYQQEGIETIRKLRLILDGIEEGLQDNKLIFPIAGPHFMAKSSILNAILYNLTYLEITNLMGKTIAQEIPQHFYVAEWNDDEIIPDAPTNTQIHDSLEEAKDCISYKDNTKVYIQKDNKFIVVSEGQYDPDLDTVLWKDSLDSLLE